MVCSSPLEKGPGGVFTHNNISHWLLTWGRRRVESQALVLPLPGRISRLLLNSPWLSLKFTCYRHRGHFCFTSCLWLGSQGTWGEVKGTIDLLPSLPVCNSHPKDHQSDVPYTHLLLLQIDDPYKVPFLARAIPATGVRGPCPTLEL